MFGLSPKLKIFQCRGNMQQDLINDLEGISKDKIAKAKNKLQEAVSELSEQEQLIISLYYREDLEFKEIAEIVGMSEKEVRKSLKKTMLKLHSKLLAEN